MAIEKIEEFTELTLDYVKWGRYETAINRLETLKEMIVDLKEQKNGNKQY